MEKYSEVIGIPVICANSGKKVGVITDVVFWAEDKEVKGFMLEKKGYEISKKLILTEDIVNLGKDALIIEQDTKIKLVRSNKKNKILCNKAKLHGLRIFSRDGVDLGVVKDVLFDCKNGHIEGLEISDGLFYDILKGRNILPLFGKVEISEYSIIVDKEATEEMQATGGGLENFINKTI